MAGHAASADAMINHAATIRRLRCGGLIAASITVGMLLTPVVAQADNSRLNNDVVVDVHTLQTEVGCKSTIKINPKLRLAAQWHADDVLNNHDLDGDVGSDGSTVADRARNAGYAGTVTEAVAINPALAINNLQVINQWYYRPDTYLAMADCANVDIGVWSGNSLDRSVVVAVFGKGDRA